jgi:hypothetical protein
MATYCTKWLDSVVVMGFRASETGEEGYRTERADGDL